MDEEFINHIIQLGKKNQLTFRQMTTKIHQACLSDFHLTKGYKSVAEMLFCGLYDIKETPCCNICNKPKPFVSESKGYRCKKSCITKERLASTTKSETITKIKSLYIDMNKPHPKDSNYSIFSRKYTSELHAFWDVSGNRNQLLYDILYDMEGIVKPKCTICHINEVSFSTTRFEYKECCTNPSCTTIHQYKNQEKMSKENITLMVSRVKATKKERYGDENYVNSKKLKATLALKTSEDWKLISDKRVDTIRKTHGYDNISQVPEIKKKVGETTFKNYGVLRFPNIDQNKIRLIMEKVGRWIPIINKSDSDRYRMEVIKLTNRVDISKLDNYDKRGRVDIEGSYHLDHKYSIFNGFINNIPPFIIANIVNLEMLSAIDNIKKSKDNSIDLETLYEGFYK